MVVIIINSGRAIFAATQDPDSLAVPKDQKCLLDDYGLQSDHLLKR